MAVAHRGPVSEAPRPVHEAQGARAQKPTTAQYPVWGVGPSRSSGASLSVGPCVEQAGHQLQQIERKRNPLRRIGVQPVVIGGSDSVELDKFQWQRDRALFFAAKHCAAFAVVTVARCRCVGTTQYPCVAHALEPRKTKASDKRKQQAGSAAHATCSCIKHLLLYYQTATIKTPTLYTMSIFANHWNISIFANLQMQAHIAHLNTLHIRATQS
jgi:hypothetical protein